MFERVFFFHVTCIYSGWPHLHTDRNLQNWPYPNRPSPEKFCDTVSQNPYILLSQVCPKLQKGVGFRKAGSIPKALQSRKSWSFLSVKANSNFIRSSSDKKHLRFKELESLSQKTQSNQKRLIVLFLVCSSSTRACPSCQRRIVMLSDMFSCFSAIPA